MPRRKRRTNPGVVYHLISRFVDRKWFITSEPERKLYLDLLGKALDGSTWRCLGYAVMSNHIHLAMVAGTEALSDWIRAVHSPFADTMNRSHQRIGPVFVRGPKDILVPDSRVGHVLAYIHNNPVRGNVVASPRQSTWTSHRSYVGADRAPRWLSVTEGLRRASLSRSEFDQFVGESVGHPVLGDVTSDEHLEELVDAYDRELLAKEKTRVAQRPPDAMRVVAAVAEAMGVPVEQLRSRRRGDRERRGRAATIVCGERLGCSSIALAQAVGLTPQAVNKHIRCAENGVEVSGLVERAMVVLDKKMEEPSLR